MRSSLAHFLLFTLISLACTPALFAQNGLRFDGNNDYIQIPNWIGIQGTTARTIEAWVKIPNTVTGGSLPIAAWGSNNVGGGKWTFRLQGGNGYIRVECEGGNISGSTDIRDGQWHHVAAVWENDGSPNILDAILYVDGIPESLSQQNSEPINTVSGIDVKVGGNHGNAYFNGTMDELRIWSEARTQAQLQANMNTELCAEPNLVLYYKFNQGVAGNANPSELIANDFSGNFRMGDLIDFALSGTNSNWVGGQTLTVPGPAVTVANQTDVDCFGDSTGSATLAVSGGMLPYIYVWSTGDSTGTANNLGAGTYNVTVVDGLLCASGVQVVITENSELQTTSAAVDINCWGATTGEAQIQGTGGTQPYTYNWSHGGNQATETGLAADTYLVTVTDDLGCTTLDTVEVVHLFDSLYITIDSVIDVTCEGGNDGQAMSSVTGGQFPFAFQWNDPAAQVFANATGLEAGVYQLIVTDGSGCTASQQAAIGFVFAEPTIDLGPDIISPTNTATITAPAGFTAYHWSTGANSSTISVAQSGTYTVTVTDENGCTNSDEINVTVSPTGIAQSLLNSPIRVFPNPASAQLFITGLPEQAQLEVRNSLGSLILQQIINPGPQTTINLSEWPAGLYFLKLRTGEGLFVQRVVKSDSR